ncbi:DNA-deoxyinosine glycosylase [Uliginosibacterium sp. H1]|uniref:DNA-deoxyinosine glycosylase n=1 Tax=Uliginosibacterium sp. H1 TaxID=3114757 RepID=UPI002E172538|nr:DNA-deoxyinosine glycosylase [Uliginosibacterium sp. H1]
MLVAFPPIARADARLLILGSMPGEASLAATQYYAHPRNAFWSIMGELCGAAPALPYAERIERLKDAGIAVWDVLAQCERQGSLDTAISPDTAEPNDFATFFAAHPAIGHVFFNGSFAETCFRRRIWTAALRPGLTMQRLPSTSPAHAGRSLAQKQAIWRDALAPLLR